jgi:3'(2'), 5'-bisphosphate nucleotidase
MDSATLVDLLDRAVEIALAAGEDIRGTQLSEVERKKDGSPLTQADLASHRRITDELRGICPRLPIVSEEGNPEEMQAARPDVFWLIDPLDGTKEFVKGNGEYTVNIALVEGESPVLGVIHAPELRWWCYAASGQGTWWALPGEEPKAVAARPRDDMPLTAAVSRSHSSPATGEFLRRHKVERTLPLGSSLKFCAVARGQADVYPRPNPTCLWDTAAGTVIAREAGCRVTGMDGAVLQHDLRGGLKHDGFVVAGPRFPMIG